MLLSSALIDLNLEERLCYIYLVERGESGARLGMYQQELSRQTGLSMTRVRSALISMKEKKFIDIRPSGKRHNLFLLEPYHEEIKIPWSWEDHDDKRIATLEKEVIRLSSASKSNQKLSSVLKGERAEVIGEIERYSGGLSLIEAYLLGQSMALVGPERLKLAWRKRGDMKNPIRGVTSMLLNKAFGTHFTPKPQAPEVTYRKIRRDMY